MEADCTTWPAMSIAAANAAIAAPGQPFEMENVTIRGYGLRTWKHAPRTLRDLFLTSRTRGDAEFLVYENDRATFEGFARASLAVSRMLMAEGVRKGDRVAIAMRNLPEWPVAFFGVVLAGAIATPLNAWWTGPELQYGLAHSGSRIAIVDPERLDSLLPHLHACPDLERIIVTRWRRDRPLPDRSARLEDVIGDVADWGSLPDLPVPEVALQPDDDATILYTSGTTGKPKGAVGSHRNYITAAFSGPSVGLRHLLRRGELLPGPDRPTPQRRTLVPIPLFHVTACIAYLGSALLAGSCIVLMRKWDAEEAMRVIERERITAVGGVPTIAWQLLEHPARDRYDLSSLEALTYGGAPGSPALRSGLHRVWPNSIVSIGWGMTETSAMFAVNGAEDYQHRPDSTGPAVAVCDLKIVGPDGQEQPCGSVGEIWGRGPNVVRGYWMDAKATAETFVDGWIRTGDLGWLDEEGFLFIVDRAKDMVLRGGENIYCAEVESALYEHPAVVDAAVIAIPHRTLGEEPGAVVTLKDGAVATESDIRSFLSGRLAAFKIPVTIRFWSEPLPRNAAGKVLKRDLQKLFG